MLNVLCRVTWVTLSHKCLKPVRCVSSWVGTVFPLQSSVLNSCKIYAIQMRRTCPSHRLDGMHWCLQTSVKRKPWGSKSGVFISTKVQVIEIDSAYIQITSFLGLVIENSYWYIGNLVENGKCNISHTVISLWWLKWTTKIKEMCILRHVSLYDELILKNVTKFNLWCKARCWWIGMDQADNFL